MDPETEDKTALSTTKDVQRAGFRRCLFSGRLRVSVYVSPASVCTGVHFPGSVFNPTAPSYR